VSSTYVQMKTVADLQKESAIFYIDAYQRGYRWTKTEVQDLLDDIREFGHIRKSNDDPAFYCLQPVIVSKATDSNAWKVIDGQQRLTTLYLIYVYYHVKEPDEIEIPFELSYNNKPKLQQCLNTFKDKKLITDTEVDKEMTKYLDDIDCFYVIEAYKIICAYLRKIKSNIQNRMEYYTMQDIFSNHMKIIWYQINDCTIEEEISVFTKINMGKIPLTNAELIKALLLQHDENDSDKLEKLQVDIAVKWDEIEAQLSDPSFWSFLVNEKNDSRHYATRIDFIFRVMARALNNKDLYDADQDYSGDEDYQVDEDANEDKFSFYVFSNYMRLLKDHKERIPDNSENYIQSIWDGVSEYYRMFKDWYHNTHWYHMIGFLVEASDEKYIDLILNLSQLYREQSTENGEGHKDHFERKLREKIIDVLFRKSKVSKKECRDFLTDLSYETSAGDIRKALLLYNIAYLEACPEDGRFPFEKYKGEDNSWDIEHINAVADTRPNDDRRDSEDNARLQWLRRAQEIPELDQIKTSTGASVKELLNTVITNQYYLNAKQNGTKDFIEVYDSIINFYGGTEPDNSLGNLTLLDSGTNRSYKNDVFPLKRKVILERTMEDVFIPPCTRNIFLKGFQGSSDLLRWNKADKIEYFDDIVNRISKYLKLEDDNEQ